MSSTRRDTDINGYRSQLWSHSESQPVREFAACLPATGSNDAIQMIITSVRQDVTVWVDTESVDGDAETIPTPDGFEVEKIGVTRHGGVWVDYNRVGR